MNRIYLGVKKKRENLKWLTKNFFVDMQRD